MSREWKHPQLGTFAYDADRGSWVGHYKLPAFRIFTWEVEPDDLSDEYELLFDSDEGTAPSETAVNVAMQVVANHQHLANSVAAVLWEDFNGRGPDSGMWWHDDLQQVAENFGYDDRPGPKHPKDLLPTMGFCRVIVRESSDGKEPFAELAFAALFEEEHGVGILTDGHQIIGTGYMYDVEPFNS